MNSNSESSSENVHKNLPKKRRLLRKRPSNISLNYNDNDCALLSDVEGEDFEDNRESNDKTWIPDESDSEEESMEISSRDYAMRIETVQPINMNTVEEGTASCEQPQSSILCTARTFVSASESVIPDQSTVQVNEETSKFKVYFETGKKRIIKRF